MAKTRVQKEAAILQLNDALKGAKGIVFANYQGLTIPQTDLLRKQCRENNAVYIASKKTLVQRALSLLGHEVDTKSFAGSVAVIASMNDEISAAKVAAEFAKKNEKLTFFGGILDGAVLSAEQVKALSMIPSKTELLSRLVGTLNAPVSGFVNVLAGNMRGLVTTLSAIKDQKTA
jgi:large subunit ribosomal protein L10